MSVDAIVTGIFIATIAILCVVGALVETTSARPGLPLFCIGLVLGAVTYALLTMLPF